MFVSLKRWAATSFVLLAAASPVMGQTPAGGFNGQVQINRGGVLAGVSEAVYPVPIFGAKCDGSTDDSAAFNSAITAAESGTAGSTLNIVKLPTGAVCKLNSSLTLDLSKMALDLNGASLDMTGTLSTASLIKLTATDLLTASGVTPNVHGWVRNGKILGPGGTSIGLDVGNPTPTTFLDLQQITSNLYIGDVGKGVNLGHGGVFGLVFDSITCADCGIGIFGASGSNGGERIVFTNATITNPTVGCIDYEDTTGEVHFDNSSCDNQATTGTYEIKAVGSRVFAVNSHWEGSYSATDPAPWQVSGSGGMIVLNGGWLTLHGNNPAHFLSNTVPAPWRGAIIENMFMGADNSGGLSPFQTGTGSTYILGNTAYTTGQNLSNVLLTSSGPPLLDRGGSATVVTFSQLAAMSFGGAYSGPVVCSDCTVGNPCAGSGSGALAVELNGVWICK